jgi:hypothetical protein
MIHWAGGDIEKQCKEGRLCLPNIYGAIDPSGLVGQFCCRIILVGCRCLFTQKRTKERNSPVLVLERWCGY